MKTVTPPAAQAVIDRLGLAAHPEGGWYRETWRAPAATAGDRSAATAILFLLGAGERSHWHRVDAAELWVFQAGDPLLLSAAGADEVVTEHRLGPDLLGGDRPQQLVAAGEWQAAEPTGGAHGWSLVTCVVVPGFAFAGFELAPPGDRRGGRVHPFDARDVGPAETGGPAWLSSTRT